MSRGTTYSGLLEKCPAVSFFDTMVTQSDDGGITVRRRGHFFSFDLAVYRRRSRGGGVWLDENGDRDDGPDPSDPCNIAAGLPQNSSTGCEDQAAGEGAGSESTCTDREKLLSLSTELQQKTHPPPGTGAGVNGCVGVCEIRNAGSDLAIRQPGGGNLNQP